GGRVGVRRAGGEGIAVEAAGEAVQVNPEIAAALAGTLAPAELTSRSVHGYVTAKFAEAVGARLVLSDVMAGRVVFLAAPR
ncbi:MAG: histidine phosphotransferase family protein, partial [Roseiarcus sp.]